MARCVLDVLVVLCLLLASSVLLAQQLPDLSGDSRLQRAVTIEHGGASLRDILQDLSRQTGVSFRISSGVSAWRACVFVRKVPAALVMNALARTFDLSWRASGEGYELYHSPEQKSRQEYKIRQTVARVKAEMQDALQRLAGQRSRDREDDYQIRSMLLSDGHLTAALHALTEDEWQRVLRGSAVLIGMERIPLRLRRERALVTTLIELYYNPLRSGWRLTRYNPAGLSSGSYGFGRREVSTRGHRLSALLLPAEASARITDKPRNPQQVIIPEALLALANAAGTGVVAEYYPLTMLPHVLTYMPSSAKELLDALDSLYVYDVKRVGDLLLFSARQRVWHRLADIPRETMARWMGEQDRFGLTFTTALEMWRLTELQRDALEEWASFMSTRYQYDAPLRSQLYSDMAQVVRERDALTKAVAHLPVTARRNLLAGKPVAISLRNPATREAFLYASAQLPVANISEAWIQAVREQRVHYGVRLITPTPEGGVQFNTVSRDARSLEEFRERIMAEGIMGTPHWFRVDAEVVHLRVGVGRQVIQSRQMEFRRYTPASVQEQKLR
ncbi:MAG: hypothetical protein NZ749_13695 [bacterium]|nr:hypothetical protein [bacterium]